MRTRNRSTEYLLPFRGVVAAGWPSPAEEELGDTLSFEEWLVPHKASSFLATVSTSAMTGAGIHADDTVIVERGRAAQSNDIVIADVDGEVVIRRYRANALIPEHPQYRAITAGEDVRILGVVTAVIRKYR